MAQNITLLGASYTAVPAVTLPKTGGGTARFDDASITTATASDVASGKVFLASDGTITTGTSSGGGGTDFIVTLSYDSQSDKWLPDCTYAELYSAYSGGKTIAWVCDNEYNTASGKYNVINNFFEYFVCESFEDTDVGIIQYAYVFESTGISLIESYTMYDTVDATAIPSDVANGKVFYNANGRAVGTASGGGSSSWTKVAETSYQVTTTNTTLTEFATWETGHSELWTSNKWIYVRIRDTAGKRNGYFYGTDTFVTNIFPANGSTTTYNSDFVLGTLSVSSKGKYSYRYGSSSVMYGVCATRFYPNGDITISTRYNSNYSRTINGTYSVEVYLLDPPTGAPIFT